MARFAFLVGVERFADRRIGSVQYAENDAVKLAEVFVNLGFDEVKQFVNGDATKAAIESKLKKAVRRLAKDDTFCLFVASHGLSENGRNYVFCHDTQTDDLLATSLSLQWILELFRSSACRHFVVFLDACETGIEIDESMRGHISELSDDELRDFFDDAEYCAGFAACRSDEKSYSSTRLQHGVWTHCLIQALSGNAKAAIERKRFVTSASLQNYLSLEVPRELRHDRGPSVRQTPWMFGGQSRDFEVADLGDILDVRRKPPPLNIAALNRILLRADETGAIHKLSGFNPKRGHWVPDDVNDAAAGFVGKIAEQEVSSDLERMFDGIRETFGYKRKDMESYGPSNGTGSIDTPAFTYAVSVTQHPEDASKYVIRREVTNFKDPQIVMSEPFNDVFDGMFDTLEFEFKKPIDLEDVIDELEEAGAKVKFDREATHCSVRLPKFPVEIVVGSTSLQLIHHACQPPSELVAAFKTFQELVAKEGLKMLPMT